MLGGDSFLLHKMLSNKTDKHKDITKIFINTYINIAGNFLIMFTIY